MLLPWPVDKQAAFVRSLDGLDLHLRIKETIRHLLLQTSINLPSIQSNLLVERLPVTLPLLETCDIPGSAGRSPRTSFAGGGGFGDLSEAVIGEIHMYDV